MSTLTDAALKSFLAIDRLNSYARSGWIDRTLRSHIYAMKRQAIIEAHSFGLASHRRIRVTVRCRSCGGTGWYSELSPCRTCSSKGELILRFIETIVVGGISWHSPSGKFPIAIEEGLGWPRNDYTDDEQSSEWEKSFADVTGDYAPAQKGTSLPVPDLAQALLDAEDFFYWPLFARQHNHDWLRRQGSYWLNLGTTTEGRCCMCTREEASVGTNRWLWAQSKVAPPLRWNALVCELCNTLHANLRKYVGAVPLPEVGSHPFVLAWGNRHMGMIPQPDFYDEA